MHLCVYTYVCMCFHSYFIFNFRKTFSIFLWLNAYTYTVCVVCTHLPFANVDQFWVNINCIFVSFSSYIISCSKRCGTKVYTYTPKIWCTLHISFECWGKKTNEPFNECVIIIIYRNFNNIENHLKNENLAIKISKRCFTFTVNLIVKMCAQFSFPLKL